jgi:hypothetical protein
MGKSTISMAIFHSYVSLPEGIETWGSQDGMIDLYVISYIHLLHCTSLYIATIFWDFWPRSDCF